MNIIRKLEAQEHEKAQRVVDDKIRTQIVLLRQKQEQEVIVLEKKLQSNLNDHLRERKT